MLPPPPPAEPAQAGAGPGALEVEFDQVWESAGELDDEDF